MNDLEEALYRLIEALERQSMDILPPYDEWPEVRAYEVVLRALEKP